MCHIDVLHHLAAPCESLGTTVALVWSLSRVCSQVQTERFFAIEVHGAEVALEGTLPGVDTAVTDQVAP